MRIKIAFFFTFLFSIILITPVVITILDDKIETAIFLEISEEEENNGKEAAKDFEINIYPSENFGGLLLNEIQKNKNIRFISKNYVSEYLKISTPPPKLLS